MITDDIQAWRHVFKLDPDKDISDESLDSICLSGTDAILVGGSGGVTYGNTVDLMSRVRRYEVPCVSEVSSLDALVPGFDYYLIPSVLNAGDPAWIVGHHAQAIGEYGHFIKWDTIAAEGYIVLNADSAVGRLTQANAALDAKEVVALATAADRLFRLPIVYLEYSGAFGDMNVVERVKGALRNSRLFYGGGIDGAEKASLALRAADTIVVGNIIYESIDRALATVPAKAAQ